MRNPRVFRAGIACSALTLLLLAGCSTSDSAVNSKTESVSADQATLTVSAAASLTDTFAEIGRAFEQQNPGATIVFNFGSSGSLAEQIMSGAPVDVFASASVATMAKVSEQAKDPVTFARNSLVVITPQSNPGGVTDFTGITSAATIICIETAPCGAATLSFLEKNNLSANSVSLEPDVRAVLTKIIADEADAGIVYRSDALAAGEDVLSFDIPSDKNVSTDYQISVVSNSANAELAQSFVDFVRGDQAGQVLRDAGFESP